MHSFYAKNFPEDNSVRRYDRLTDASAPRNSCSQVERILQTSASLLPFKMKIYRNCVTYLLAARRWSLTLVQITLIFFTFSLLLTQHQNLARMSAPVCQSQSKIARLARPIRYAVERRVLSVGAKPTQQLSLLVGSSRSGSWRPTLSH